MAFTYMSYFAPVISWGNFTQKAQSFLKCVLWVMGSDV